MGSNMDKASGRVKQAAGDLTGDKDLEREGEVEEKSGKVKEAVEDVKDRVEGAIDSVKERVKR